MIIDDLIKANLPVLKTVFIVGAVAGAAVGGTIGAGLGYAAGTLLAPKSGKELRDDIISKVLDFTDSFSGNKSNASESQTV